MSFFQSTEQLNEVLELLFSRIHQHNPEAVGAVSKSRLIIRLQISSPNTWLTINGRVKPPEITFGADSLRPDIDVQLSADALHSILFADLPLSKALSSKQIKVRGSIWKSIVLEKIFRSGQAIYPQVLDDLGLSIV